MKTIYTYSAEETLALGEKLARNLIDKHVVVLLEGDLASGKTTLTKGIAKGLGIEKTVNSPTFTILKVYPINNGQKLYHLDLYRLSEVGSDFDLEDYIDSDDIVVIEWPFQVNELLPNEYLLIKIEKLDDNTRVFHFDSHLLDEEVLDHLWKLLY